MSDYTTKTASLKASTVDTRKIDAKQIDTKTLNINGISIDEKLKQAAIASRGNLLIFGLTDGIVNECNIFVKDGQVLDEPIECVGQIFDDDLGIGSKKYLGFADNGVSVFNMGTTVNKCVAITAAQDFEEMKLKELVWTDLNTAFELGEIDDNLDEIYGGAFYNGGGCIFYHDNAYYSMMEQPNTASTYSLRGENTSILDKLRQTVQKNS